MPEHDTIILIPCYNEEKTIKKVFKKIRKFGKVLIVDDGSTDATKKILQENKIKFIRNKKNLGYEKSLIIGFKHIIKFYKNSSYILTIDADGELLSENIPKLINMMKNKNSDILIGHRSKFNRFSESILNFIFNYKFQINDPISGLKMYKIKVLRNLKNKISNNFFLVDIILKAVNLKYSIKNIKVKVKKRKDSSRAGSILKSNLKILMIVFSVILSKIRIKDL